MFRNKNRRKELWQKLRFKYKISATNENTLEEIWRFRSSIFWGALLFFIFGAMITIVTAALIITTPVRNYLPGYLDTEIRDKALQAAIEIESLEKQLNLQEAYLGNLRDVLSGNRAIDSIKVLDSVFVSENDPMLLKYDREKKFVENYEQEEKYNLSVLVNEDEMPMSSTAFYKPIKGFIFEGFNPSIGNYGIKVQVSGKETVLAVLEGTVIYAGYDLTDGNTIQIQHINGFISIYKNNTNLLVKAGQKVKTGEAIASLIPKEEVSLETKKADYLTFELWYRAKPVDPEKYIYF